MAVKACDALGTREEVTLAFAPEQLDKEVTEKHRCCSVSLYRCGQVCCGVTWASQGLSGQGSVFLGRCVSYVE